MNLTALYPGSFDPMTYGHLDILERATHMFDNIIVAIAKNTSKEGVFSVEERQKLIEECVQGHHWGKNVEVDNFTGLLVEYAKKRNVKTLIRGVRQISDFEYEFRMALMNRRLAPEIDTLFLMPSEELTFVSASLVREIAYWGGELSQFVPENVARALQEKYERNKA